MSKKSRILKKTQAQLLTGSRPVLRAKGPSDVLAMIPYLVGFTPTDSIVVLALEGPRRRFGPCLRIDLASHRDAAAQADYLAALVAHHLFESLIVVAYSEDHGRAAAVVEPLLAKLNAAGVSIVEVLRADGRQWWSYLCADAGCCDQAGHLYDCDSSPLAATAVVAGMGKAASREELRACFAPGDERLRAQVAATCDVLDANSQRPSITGLVGAALEAQETLTVEALAALAVGVQSIVNRDVVWSGMERSNAAQHLHVWAQVTRAAPDSLLPPVGSLAGFAAWLSGSGVLASHAVERVQAVDPTYSMNLLLLRCLELTVNPREWERSRTPPL